MNLFSETIMAVATPVGKGALSVIRLSGSESWEAVSRLLSIHRKDIETMVGHTLFFDRIMDGEEVLDEVLVSIFKAPASFTGEDCVEISCHASLYIVQRVLQLLGDEGIRMATPGEFTQRAFLNGKLDLSQAEAVGDLIASESKAAHRMAMHQMRGGFSKKIRLLREQLIHFSAMIELELDFSEEDVEFANREELLKLLNEIAIVIEKLVQSFRMGNVMKNGIPVAIIGEPNVGKSTLLNQLLDEERAIVSDIAGTTRDTIEEKLHVGGHLYRFIDTAGIRESNDKIESVGIERAMQKIEEATIVLLVLDATKADKIQQQFIKLILNKLNDRQQLIILWNKVDISTQPAPEFIPKDVTTINVSAKKGEGIQRLLDTLVQMESLYQSQESVIVSNERHHSLLKHALEALLRGKEGITDGVTNDLVAQDIRQVLSTLGEITGEITTDEILGDIFTNFCIGK